MTSPRLMLTQSLSLTYAKVKAFSRTARPRSCDIHAIISAFLRSALSPVGYGPRRDLIGLAVYQRAGGQRVTMTFGQRGDR